MKISLLTEKISRAKETGYLWYRIKRKLHGLVPVFLVRNKNLQFRNYTDRTYRRMFKRYKTIIKNDYIDKKNEQLSSNKIWICWFQGLENAPELVKTTISSIKKSFPNNDIVILTNDNLDQYTRFPAYVIEKRERGRISAAHFSDLLRIELLCRYGGMWIDATVLCTGEGGIPKYICDADLFVYKSLDSAGLDMEPTVCSSWFISAKSNNPILLLTKKLLWQYWKDYDILNDYFLFHIFLAMASRKYNDLWKQIPVFPNTSPHVLGKELLNEFSEQRWQEIKSMSVFHKLDHHKNYSNGENTMYRHIVLEYLYG